MHINYAVSSANTLKNTHFNAYTIITHIYIHAHSNTIILPIYTYKHTYVAEDIGVN